ncbi:Uncharacterised protein [uncultured archaeon]|nr:Uncharacterised protein [uncultured archaeon]
MCPKYAIAYSSSFPKDETVVGVTDPERKIKIPCSFSLEEAEAYLESDRQGAVSRGYDHARIHVLNGWELGPVHLTFELGWRETENNGLVERVL